MEQMLASRTAQLAPVAAPDAAAAKPNIFERLRALNNRLSEQSARLEAPRAVASPAAASRQFLALLHSNSCASIQDEEILPTKATRLANPMPAASPCHAEDEKASPPPPPSDELVPVSRRRPITAPPSTAAPHTKDPSRLLRTWLSSASSAATSAQEWPEYTDTAYRSWQHNTNYFRDGKLWQEFVADFALFAAARVATLNRRSSSSSSSSSSSAGNSSIRVWSCGCSSGEELYTCRMAYDKWVAPTFAHAFGCPAPEFVGVGTDRSGAILDVARSVSIEWSEAALALVPPDILRAYFEERPEPQAEKEQRLRDAAMNGGYSDKPKRRFTLSGDGARDGCTFRVEDTSEVSTASSSPSPDLYDLILCRYSIFLYASDESAARRALARITAQLAPHGVLLLGATDAMPQCASQLLEQVPLDELFAAAEGVDEKRSGGQPLILATPEKLKHPLINAWRLKQPRARPVQRARSAARGGVAAALAPSPAASQHTRPASAAPSAAAASSEKDSAIGEANLDLLRAAESLSHFRRLLGLRTPFAEAAPRFTNPVWTSERSAAIMASSAKFAKGGVYDGPLENRTAEYERRRRQKLMALRAEREEAEMAEIRAARDAIKQRREASSHRAEFVLTDPRNAQRARPARSLPTQSAQAASHHLHHGPLPPQPWQPAVNKRPTTMPQLTGGAPTAAPRSTQAESFRRARRLAANLEQSPYKLNASVKRARAAAATEQQRSRRPARGGDTES